MVGISHTESIQCAVPVSLWPPTDSSQLNLFLSFSCFVETFFVTVWFVHWPTLRFKLFVVFRRAMLYIFSWRDFQIVLHTLGLTTSASSFVFCLLTYFCSHQQRITSELPQDALWPPCRICSIVLKERDRLLPSFKSLISQSKRTAFSSCVCRQTKEAHSLSPFHRLVTDDFPSYTLRRRRSLSCQSYLHLPELLVFYFFSLVSLPLAALSPLMIAKCTYFIFS